VLFFCISQIPIVFIHNENYPPNVFVDRESLLIDFHFFTYFQQMLKIGEKGQSCNANSAVLVHILLAPSTLHSNSTSSSIKMPSSSYKGIFGLILRDYLTAP
jgi:hypothetical protein